MPRAKGALKMFWLDRKKAPRGSKSPRRAARGKGFTLPELVTAAAIMSSLSYVGVKAYRARSKKVDMTEAKHSLTYLYAAQKNFHSEWNTYHENLAIVGAYPEEGSVGYDVGFKVSALSVTDGNLGSYPDGAYVLNKKDCASWDKMCSGLCHTALSYFFGTGGSRLFRQSYSGSWEYFRTAQAGGFTSNYGCTVDGGGTGRYLVSAVSSSGYKANASSFKAAAVKKRASNDEWSIDEDKKLSHVRDGS